ncbi:ESPR-type extended signal peptide-containing protein [Acidaminococcus fermentans]|uniref:ESPR-type extended signal peptide-containing protein n=1 Tax=Acidaminococcus fermentans TaxID=905 RepID=UPI00241C9D51|nr:ESPR-type extended signal peptide-containing protein [Acidaminococcus fermentans]
MNRIYKVIWSKVRCSWVVVSEIARNHGKEHSSRKNIPGGVYILGLALALGLALPSGALAADPVNLGNNASAAYDDKGNLTIGNTGTVAEGANKAGKNNTTIGTDTDTLRNVTEGETSKNGQPMDETNDILVKGEGQANDLAISTEADGSTAVGYQSRAEGERSTAIGNNAKITDKPVVYYADAEGKKTASADNAAWYKDASGNPTKVPRVFRDANGNTTTTPQYKYTHTVTAEDGTTSTVTDITSDISKANKDSNNNPEYSYQKSDNTDYLYSVTLYQAVSNSIAAGTNVTANGNNAVVVGYNSTADNSAVAVGDTATASGDNTIAIGTKSKATDTSGTGSIAIGKSVEASGGSTAVGLNGTNASGSSSAYGNNATASNGASAFGKDTHASNGGTAVGNSTTAYDSDSSAFGSGTHASSGGTAVGNSTTASGNSSAFGYGTNASGISTAVGHSATADRGSVALGDGVRAGSSSGGAVAIGRNGTSADGTAVAVGDNVHASYSSFASGLNGTNATNGGIAYGNNVSAKESGVAVGRNGTKASGNDSTAIGSNVSASSGSFAAGSGETSAESSSIAIGMKYNGSYQTSASGYGMALGFGNTASGSAVAIGHKTSAYGGSYALGSNTDASNSSIAIGIGTSTWDDSQKTKASGGSVAIGKNTQASNSAYAVGSYAYANGGSYAFGSSAHAENNSYAIGDSAYARSNSLAIGDSAKSDVSDGIALGNNSTVYRGATAGLDPRNGQPSENTTPTWKSTYGALSIGAVDSDGNVTGTRQIIGVAAGTKDTDAVNLAQLKQVAQGFSIHDYGVNSVDTITDTNYNNAGAQGNNSLAAGVSASATGNNAVAIGYGAQAEGKGATVIGKNAKATGQYATAFGGLETTDKKTGKTVNVINTASGASSTAFGQGTQARGNASLAFGLNTIAGGADGSGQQSVAFGEDTQALGGRSLAFGEKTIANYNDSVAFGNDTRALSTGATAFGNRTRALSQYATAWGNATVAADAESTAWGTDTIAGAKLDANGAVTNIYTYKNNPDDKNEQAKTATEQMDVHGNLAYIRADGTTAGIKQMPIDSGNEKHDYVVLAGKDGKTYVRDYQGSLWKVNVAADGKVTVDTTAGKDKNGKVYNGKNGAKQSLATTTVNGAEVAITPDNVLTKAHEGSNGYTIEGYANATAFGYSTEASGDNATAFGKDTKASAAGATAFGYQTVASGENATAFGENSTAAAKNSLAALGGTVAASATNAAAIGSGAQATLADSVALGSGAVADRASGAKGYDMLTKGNTTNTSTAWVSNANAIAVGNGSTLTRQITGVAAGSQDTDAVNVAQLKAAGFKVTTQNDGSISSSILNGDTLDFEGKDNAIVSTSKDSKTITVAVSRTPTFDSATFYNPNPSEGQNNEKVTISNGHISTYNKDQQERAVLGTDNQGSGTLHLINNDLSQVHVYTQNSKEDGNDGITRMYYISSSGNGGEIQGIHTIAVLDDGINYAGDNVKPNTSDKVVVKHKLNSTMDITGGADTNNLAGGNIGVVATPAVEDDQGNITQKAKLELKLNKDLTGLNTVTAGNAKIGSASADALKLTENGAVTEKTAPAGSYVTGLDNKYWNTTNPSYVSGRAATEDQLAAVSGTINQGLSFTTNTKDATNTTDNYKGYKVVNRKLGDTISIKAGDADPDMKYVTTNLTSQIAENGDITISMAESPTFNIVTATSVNLSPKDITTKDQAGYTASARLDAHYRDASLNPEKNVTMADGSTGMVRLHYHDGENTIHDLATMDDGQIYAGDIKTDGSPDTTGFGRKMNQKTIINGGVKEKDKLTDNNIGVVSNGTDTLTVKLAKNLTKLESVQAGKTTIDDNGLTIRKSDDDSSKNVIVLGDQVAFGDNQVNNMGSGASKITKDDQGNETYEYNTLNNGANIGDVKNIASSTVQPVIDTVNKGWELDVNSTKQKAVTPDSPKVNLIQGQNITITGDTANTDNVTIATADDVRFNTVRVGGSKTDTGYTGGIVIGKQSGGNSANPDENDYITGLKNTNWDSNKIQSGRAATEDQLKKVADDIKQGTVAGDVYVTGGEVAYHTDGGTDNGKTTVNDGTGKLTLTENNKTSKVEITGLHDYYVTGGTVTDDGTKLELTRNDRDSSGNPQKITVDLSNVLSNDLHLVQNPAEGSEGKYKVDTTTGTVTLKVQNADGTKSSDITIGGFEGLGQGLEFGANKMAKDGGGNPVTNQLGSTIKITGAGTKELQDYSGKNLLTSVEQAADGTTTIHVLMDRNISADGVTVGQAGTDGVAGENGEVGQAGTIGINGKNGVQGDGGKEIITTTIIRTEKGQPGENGATGKPGVDGKDITRIVYQNDQDQVDGKDGTHTVATLDDGLKFSGDDNKVITKKLNENLQFVGGADKAKLTQNNIGINELEDGKLTIQLVNTPDLGTKGNLKAGDAHIGWFDGDALNMTRDGTNPSGNKAGAGSYATGLSNKDWNVADPEYVSGRAATEDQLAKVSEAINNAATAAGKRTVVTVNDKSHPAAATPNATAGAYGDYDSTGGNLMIAAKKDDEGQMTYNIKLNDQLAIGKKGTPGQNGKDGTDGKVTVETSKGTTVVIGHDGEPGKDGKDGISVKGQDGKDGVTLSVTNGKDGKDGSEGHIGLTGPKGKDGKDASADIHVKNGQNGVDGTDGNNGKDGMDRIVYEDHNGKTHEVATMDDGLKFMGNDGQEVSRKLNEILSIKGGLDKDAVATASSKNLGVRKSDNGLEIVMTDTPDFTKVTVGGDKKITIGGQTNSDTKNPINGNYITGLDNKAWDKDNVVADRAATEGQLKEAINEISGKDKGGFGLAAEKGGSVQQDLGGTITVKGDTIYKEDGTTVDKEGNIKTSVDNGAIKVELNKDVDLGQNGSVKAGNTTINKDGVDTNKVTIKDSTISISKDGINAGGKQITYVASGGDVGSNAANIDDVKRIAGNMKTEINNNVTEVTNKVNQMGDELTQVKQDVKADRQYLGDEGTAKKVNVKFGSALSLTGGAQVDNLAGEGNIGVIQKEMDDPDHAGQKINGLSIRLAKDLTGLNSVTTGNTTINNGGLTVNTGDANRTITVQDGNVNMGDNQIHNVAPGTAPTDAVNVSQLQQTGRAINQLGSSLDKLGTRVDRVGANSAALAALHPLDFDPDDKLDFAVGAGNYSGANAVALGAFYRPNEDVMFSLGGSTGGGENMVNLGATFKLGQHNHVSNSRVAMAKEIRDLKALVARQDGEMQQLKTLMNQLAGKPVMRVDKDALFPDIPENHWAYEYVIKLARAGIIEGYEDGQFKGDRMMTRYEFAALLYRAIMAGAAANPDLNQDGTLGKLVKEFDGELKYIRIDVIEKDKHGKPTIERVRTVEDSEKHHGK